MQTFPPILVMAPSRAGAVRNGCYPRLNGLGIALYRDIAVSSNNSLGIPRDQAERAVRPDLNLKPPARRAAGRGERDGESGSVVRRALHDGAADTFQTKPGLIGHRRMR